MLSVMFLSIILFFGIAAGNRKADVLGEQTIGSIVLLEDPQITFCEDFQIPSRRTIRLLMVLICFLGLSVRLRSPYTTTVRRVYFRELQMQTAVLCYIHNQDGKK